MFKCQFKIALTGILFLLFLNWSCTKIDTTELGQNLIPVIDNIHTFDTTLDVIGNNFDSLAGACDSISVNDLHALGIIDNDPIFGKTSADIFVEFKPSTYPYTVPDKDSLIFDSAFLVLHYSHSFGDSLRSQKVQVFPLVNFFNLDSTYTTCNTLEYDNFNLLGERTYTPKDLDDSIHSIHEDATSQLRIPIDKTFIQAILDDTSALKSDSAFKVRFKGFAIIADRALGGNALNYFSLTAANSRLSMYYTSTKSTKDTLVYNFPLSASSGHANTITRERGLSEITGNVSHPPTGDNFFYVQTSPGSYVNLKIPGLQGLSNRVIHRAELIAEQEYSGPSDIDFAAPRVLYLDTKDTSTNDRYIPIPCDFTMANQQPNFSYFGGIRKSYIDAQGKSLSKYVFNISRYVQTIVTRGSNNAIFRLRAPYDIVNRSSYIDRCNQGISSFNFTINNIAEGRVKLNGTNNTPNRIRLRIVYSIL